MNIQVSARMKRLLGGPGRMGGAGVEEEFKTEVEIGNTNYEYYYDNYRSDMPLCLRRGTSL